MVGMGSASRCVCAGAPVFAEVDELWSQNLSRLMFEGPESDLTLTENSSACADGGRVLQ